MTAGTLLPHQGEHVKRMVAFFRNPPRLFGQNSPPVYLDASATGTGKTYTAMALCAELRLKPVIICPKSVLSTWTIIAADFGVTPLLVSNYEQVIAGNTPLYTGTDWHLGDCRMVIFDEAHVCKNDTRHATLLLGLKRFRRRARVLLLSATIADKIDAFRNFGCLMDFYSRPATFHRWIKLITKGTKGSPIRALHGAIFPKYGHRMRLRDMETVMESRVKAHCFKMDNAAEITRQYDLIEASYASLKERTGDAKSHFARLVHARQAIEILKVPTFINLIQANRVRGKSVVLFVNFHETLELVARALNVTCVIHGKQTLAERNAAVADFQANRARIILCNIHAGGVGISLHDLHGEHPRASIISPTWSAQDFVQCLGRIDRAGTKTCTVQKIIFCAGTVEKRICKVLLGKLDNLSLLNDGDLDTYPVDLDTRRYELSGNTCINRVTL
jgi:hypothetical protein